MVVKNIPDASPIIALKMHAFWNKKHYLNFNLALFFDGISGFFQNDWGWTRSSREINVLFAIECRDNLERNKLLVRVVDKWHVELH